jgi:fructokinase
VLGGIEAGGTKWVCAVGGPDALVEVATFPTTTPDETLGRAIAFLGRHELTAVGVGCFGPVDLARGAIAATPKPGWRDVEVAAPLRAALGVPVAFDTDVNAAALGEHRHGAGRGVDDLLYVTVGTGIGGGAISGGRLVHGLVHPELGHMRIPRDPDDAFRGACPYHGDCLEGLASGAALRARWGRGGEELVGDERVWGLEARYLALGLANAVATLSPRLVVLGGGVMATPGLLERVRGELDALLAGYVAAPELVAPGLGNRSGVVGALCLASADADRTAA